MNIRSAQISDLEQLVDFQITMALESENLHLDKDILQQGILSVLNDKTKGSYFVVEDESTLIASLLITYEWSDWRNKMVWWIQSVFVVPEFRQKGVFKKLYNHIQAIVENDDTICGLRLYVDKQNIRAQNVYRNIGMNGEHYQVFEWMK